MPPFIFIDARDQSAYTFSASATCVKIIESKMPMVADAYNFSARMRTEHARGQSQDRAGQPYSPIDSRIGAQLFSALLLVVYVWFSCFELKAAIPEFSWLSRTSPLPANQALNAITYGRDQFAAVSDKQGHVILSPDGTAWTLHSTGVDTVLFGIAASPDLFVTVGQYGAIFSSADGQTWTRQESGTRSHLNDVTYANGRFIAVGDAGTVLSSLNGVIWTSHSTDQTNFWQSSAYGNGLHVLVGYAVDNGEARSAISPDLSTWSVRSTGAGRYLSDVVYGQGQFVACGYAGLYQTSADGSDWSIPGQASFAWLFSISQIQDLFLAVGENGSYSTSNDTTQWNRGFFPTGETIYSVAFGRDTFVAVGQDGIIWQSTAIPNPSAIVLRDVVKQPGRLQFSFSSQPGRVYRIDSCSEFPQWNRVTNLISTGSVSTLSVPAPPGSGRFFRVVLP